MTSRLSGYQCHTSFDELCSSCNTVTVTLAIGQDLIIINKKVDYDEIFASYLGEIDIFRVLFFIRLICVIHDMHDSYLYLCVSDFVRSIQNYVHTTIGRYGRFLYNS